MKKLLIGLVVFLLLPGVVVANELEETSVKLERMKTGVSPLPILVTVKTGTLRNENELLIKVGDLWEVDQNPVNIVVDSTAVPAGVTPWPGLGVVSVEGNVIKFSSGNLTLDTKYGFVITAGVGNNPIAGSESGHKWLVETRDKAGGVDNREVKVPVVAEDTISITGRVGALASDFDLELSADRTDELREGDVVEYMINYGSNLKNSTKPLVLTASWTRGTIEGASVPSVDIVDYVIGSGSTAYGSVPAVIDVVNRKIVWTINTFPPETQNKTVSFKLKVNDSYSGINRVRFEVDAILNGANVVTKSASVENVLAQKVLPTSTPTTPIPTLIMSPTATSTIGPESTKSPTPSLNLTPTMVIRIPTKTIVRPIINKLDIVELSGEKAVIEVESNVDVKGKILYGQNPLKLDKTLTVLSLGKKLKFELTGLIPDKNYYFKVEVNDDQGGILLSDLFVIRTAKKTNETLVDLRSIALAVENTVVFDASEEGEKTALVVVLPEQSYSIRMKIAKSDEVKSILVYIRDSKVLGVSSEGRIEPNSYSVDLSEVGNGNYVGQLKSPKTLGFYEAVARIEDIHGNIREQVIGVLKVSSPIKILDEKGWPVENAKITIYRYRENKRIYELLGPQTFSVNNPVFSDDSGAVRVFLPKGKYRIDVEELGYEKQQVDFQIGAGEGENMPTVRLNKRKITLVNAWQYYSLVMVDLQSNTEKYLSGVVSSFRIYKLLSVFVWITFLFVLWSAFASFLRIGWWLVPLKLWSNVSRGVGREDQKCVSGVVIDKKTHKPIWKSDVFLLDGKFNKVLGGTKTNILGEFKMVIPKSKSYRMAAKAVGFETTPMQDFSVEGLTAGAITIRMDNQLTEMEKLEILSMKLLKLIANFVISLWLIVLLIVEIVFTKRLGLLITWPWMLMSIINILGVLYINLKRV